MHIDFTVYPARIAEAMPTVGFNMYNGPLHPRIMIGGSPCMPIAEFDRLISGTNQYADFLQECAKFGIDIKLYTEL